MLASIGLKLIFIFSLNVTEKQSKLEANNEA